MKEGILPEFGELLKVIPDWHTDPPPPYLSVVDKDRWKEVVKIQLEFQISTFKNQRKIIEDKINAYEQLSKLL